MQSFSEKILVSHLLLGRLLSTKQESSLHVGQRECLLLVQCAQVNQEDSKQFKYFCIFKQPEFYVSIYQPVPKSGSNQSLVLNAENVPAKAGQHSWQWEFLITAHLVSLLLPQKHPFSSEPSHDFHCSLFLPPTHVFCQHCKPGQEHTELAFLHLLDFRHLEKKGILPVH